MREALTRAWDHLAWADERVGGLLAELGGDAPRDALRLLAHLVAAERIWLDRIGSGSSDRPVWPDEGASPPAEASLRLSRRNVEEARGLLADATVDGLERAVSYRTTSGAVFETALGDILLHVALHGAYHRGQVARALRGAGLDPVNTDYITWVRDG